MPCITLTPFLAVYKSNQFTYIMYRGDHILNKTAPSTGIEYLHLSGSDNVYIEISVVASIETRMEEEFSRV